MTSDEKLFARYFASAILTTLSTESDRVRVCRGETIAAAMLVLHRARYPLPQPAVQPPAPYGASAETAERIRKYRENGQYGKTASSAVTYDRRSSYPASQGRCEDCTASLDAELARRCRAPYSPARATECEEPKGHSGAHQAWSDAIGRKERWGNISDEEDEIKTLAELIQTAALSTDVHGASCNTIRLIHTLSGFYAVDQTAVGPSMIPPDEIAARFYKAIHAHTGDMKGRQECALLAYYGDNVEPTGRLDFTVHGQSDDKRSSDDRR